MDAPAASCEHGQGMNVLIPIGGSGLRFAQAGLSMPKPMLKLAGRPMLSWVLDSLNLTAADTIFVGLSHEYAPVHRSPTHPTTRRLPQAQQLSATLFRTLSCRACSACDAPSHRRGTCSERSYNWHTAGPAPSPCACEPLCRCKCVEQRLGRAAMAGQRCSTAPPAIVALDRTRVDGVRRTDVALRPS
jgi:hypothetical protein